jgi:hypothetical protein
MVRVERQASSGSLRFLRTQLGVTAANYYFIILAVASCCFGVCWGYWIGCSSWSNHKDSKSQIRSLNGGGDPSVDKSAATAVAGDIGWSTIQVFYGDQSLLHDAAAGGWHSQVKQDQVVAALLRNKRDGFFVDLASNDAVSLSNTFALEQRLNWNGAWPRV